MTDSRVEPTDDSSSDSFEAVNAAVDSATATYGLSSSGPSGATWGGAISLLRQFTVAIMGDDPGLAVDVLSQVESSYNGDDPEISQVVNAGLRLLDGWSVDIARRAAVRAARVPDWESTSRAAARAALLLARTDGAFDGLDALSYRFQGGTVFEGTILAVAAVVAAAAAARGISVLTMADEMLAGPAAQALVDAVGPSLDRPRPLATRGNAAPGDFRGGVAAKKALKKAKASGNPATRGLVKADRAMMRDFEAWLHGQAEISAPDVPTEMRMFASVIELARGKGFDPLDPMDVEYVVDELFLHKDESEPGSLMAGLDVLRDYVHFQMDKAGGEYEWGLADDTIGDVLDQFDPTALVLETVMAESEEIDSGQRAAALAETAVVAMVKNLLEWIGKGRPVTATGGLRRADIAGVAAMLGVSAVGVNKVTYEPGQSSFGWWADEDGDDVPASPPVIQAKSMWELPLLPSWWSALQTAGVISLSGTRVYPGEAAIEWLAGAVPPLPRAEMVAMVFLAQEIVHKNGYYDFFSDYRIALITASILRALHPGIEFTNSAPTDFASVLGHAASAKLADFEKLGFLTRDDMGEYVVPTLLRGTLAKALMGVSILLSEDSEGSEGSDEYDIDL